MSSPPKARYISFRHAQKVKGGEPSPTAVAINEGDGKIQTYEIATDSLELDFLKGRFPIQWRPVDDDEILEWFDQDTNPNGLHQRHCKWRKLKTEEITGDLPENRIRAGEKGNIEIVTKVPVMFEGVRAGDVIGMILGGSGDRFAYALSNHGERIGAQVYRVPARVLKEIRGHENTKDDHILLVDIIKRLRHLFYLCQPRDRVMIEIKAAFQSLMAVKKDRIACGQRIIANLRGGIYLSKEGCYPDGEIESLYKQAMDNDEHYQALVSEENNRANQLAKAIKKSDIWDTFFENIPGFGPRIVAGLLAAIVDVRRFIVKPDPTKMAHYMQQIADSKALGCFSQYVKKVQDKITSNMSDYDICGLVAAYQREQGKPNLALYIEKARDGHHQRALLRRKALQRGQAKLRKFCGVHVILTDKDGNPVPPERQFPRRRHGSQSDWNPHARQSLWLFTDQTNRQKDSEWGKRFRANKDRERKKHPSPVQEQVEKVVNGQKKLVTVTRYTNQHIHNRARWVTAQQVVNELFKIWVKLEQEANRA